jgi:dTDP-4-amino-4,6-dideoxygalactose transaminase
MTVTTVSEAIPLVDLRIQHAAVEAEVTAEFAEVMSSGGFIGGPRVAAFEQDYAAYTGVTECVGVANGTDAIELALRALGIGPGDEVIIPANTFVATAEAVVRAGATPVFVDADPEYLLIDVEAALRRVGPRTRAVIPVHLYGQSAATEQLTEALGGSDVCVVEDAAQSQGATRAGHPVGSVGDVAATSFYPGKNLGAYGDAGAVLTSEPDVARAVRLLGAHGSLRKYVHESLGFNSRLDALQAVVLSAKLRRLDGWNALRRQAAATYQALLADVADLVLPATMPGNEHVWHLYVVRVPQRDRVLAELNEAGIGAAIHYPTPVHLQPAFAEGDGPGSFPVAEAAAAQILSLPLYPGITEEQQERVAAALCEALGSALR